MSNSTMSRQASLEFIKSLAAHLDKIDKFMPCADIMELGHRFWVCLMIMYEKDNTHFIEMTKNDFVNTLGKNIY